MKDVEVMKKIGIITSISKGNYGNKLQNYALLKTLKDLGYEVETVNRKKEDKVKLIFYKLKTLIRDILKINYRSGICRRENIFRKFDKKYLNISRYWTHENHYKSGINEEFDYFVCGSDQIWNPMYDTCLADMEGATAYIAPSEKRIAYAASFGVGELPKKYMNMFKELLKDMKKISVREESGARIIRDILNVNVSVVLDPTLLLSKEEWCNFQNKPNVELPEKYIATYFIGNKSEEVKSYIDSLSKRYNYPIVDIYSEWLWDKDIDNLKYFSFDPTEFVYVISHCQIFFTDSFHGSVFATIFDKPFRVFERNDNVPDMWSRLENLIKIIGNNSVIGQIDENLDNIIGEKIKYNKENIDMLKDKSIKYLKQSLNFETEL